MLGRPGCLGADQLKANRDGDASCDLVLYRGRIARIAIEPPGPQIDRSFRVAQRIRTAFGSASATRCALAAFRSPVSNPSVKRS
jgi:hypothetical protein